MKTDGKEHNKWSFVGEHKRPSFKKYLKTNYKTKETNIVFFMNILIKQKAFMQSTRIKVTLLLRLSYISLELAHVTSLENVVSRECI